MNKYLLVASLSLQEYFAYRLNFILWRVRVVVSILISYFLWNAIYLRTGQVFGYQMSQMLTYILLTIFINSVVFSTQTARVAEEINLGLLSRYLIHPISYFKYTLSRDIADKIINTFFSFFEFLVLFILLKPPVVIQTNMFYILLFLITVVLAGILYFEINILLSSIAFWSYETWAPRFIFLILVSFLAGNYFPLDIVPSGIYKILALLPFTYLVFFPLKIYLGQFNSSFLLSGFVILSVWVVSLFFLMKYVWRKGLKVYTAEGQ